MEKVYRIVWKPGNKKLEITANQIIRTALYGDQDKKN